MQNACRGEGDYRDEVNIAKVNALIDMHSYYPILRRGTANDHRDLYKLMQSQPKRMSVAESAVSEKMASEYQIAFSKSPDGIVLGLSKGKMNIDPAVAGQNSKVEDWLKYFQKELEMKFKDSTDAFRQFNIRKNGKVNFHEFNFILDTLSIRFSKEATREMFDYMDGDCDGKLNYADFVNLKQFSMLASDAVSINSFSTNPTK